MVKFQKLFVSFLLMFLVLEFGGKALGFMQNAMCYRWLGCNAGFFGYDALVHFVGGITIAIGVLWLSKKSKKLDFFHIDEIFWKRMLIILAVAALIGVVWEALEFSYDLFRVLVLHINLLYPNQLAQPSNADTMGDLVFGLTGAFGAGLIAQWLWPNNPK